MKHLHTAIDEELHKRLRIEIITSGLKQEKFLADAIRAYLDKIQEDRAKTVQPSN